MELIFQSPKWNSPQEGEILLISVVRDEQLLIDYFIDYYRRSGVTHFIFIDNASIDSTAEKIVSFPNQKVKLFAQGESYSAANFGMDWVNTCIRLYAGKAFCLVVDVDEFLICSQVLDGQLSRLVETLIAQESGLLSAFLVDMYPESIGDCKYRAGTSPLDSNPYYDRLNDTYYKWNEYKLLQKYGNLRGGMRARLFGLDNVCLNKFPLFLAPPEEVRVAPGCHKFMRGGEIVSDPLIFKTPNRIVPSFLLHFKFIKPQLADVFRTRIIRNEDWDNSSEYRAYLATMTDRRTRSLCQKDVSVPFQGYEQLFHDFNCLF
jgi:hypothetical protein